MNDWEGLSEVERLQKQREITCQDLLSKYSREDWHGVADAAMDLREIDAELRVHGAREAGVT